MSVPVSYPAVWDDQEYYPLHEEDKELPRALPPEEQTPEQIDRVGLSLKPVPLTRAIDRKSGRITESDEPAGATPRAPEPAAAPHAIDRVPVTRLLFLLVYGQEQRGGVGIVTAPSP